MRRFFHRGCPQLMSMVLGVGGQSRSRILRHPQRHIDRDSPSRQRCSSRNPIGTIMRALAGLSATERGRESGQRKMIRWSLTLSRRMERRGEHWRKLRWKPKLKLTMNLRRPKRVSGLFGIYILKTHILIFKKPTIPSLRGRKVAIHLDAKNPCVRATRSMTR